MEAASFYGGVRHKRYSGQQETAPNKFYYMKKTFMILILSLIAIPIFITVFLQNLPMEAVFNDEDFIIRNFNFEGNIGLLSIGATAVLLFGVLKVVEFFLVIYASIKTSNGELYKYPLTIPFIK